MTHVTIVTKDYILIVSNEGINDLDFVYDLDMSRIVIADHLTVSTSKAPLCWYYKKIISHLPLNGSPYLDGVDVLPPIGDVEVDDVEKLAREEILYNDSKREWWKQGYNKAREKYKFTEEDIRAAIAYGRCLEITKGFSDITISESTLDSYIQSLQQPKLPTGFECEMKCGRCYSIDDECWSAKECTRGSDFKDIPQTITNSEGRTQWVGKWVY